MSQVPAGWFNDPYGRYQLRYWDGQQWTEHVTTNGQQSVDPMGSTTPIPIATPATAGPLDTDGLQPGGTGAIPFLDRMGPTVFARPQPSLRAAVAGLGGAITASGFVILVTGDSPSRGKLIGVAILVLAFAWALRLGVKVDEVESAALGMAVIGIAVFGISATASDGKGGFLTGLVVGGLYLGAWLAPGFRGRNLLLALGLLVLLAAFGSLSGTDVSSGRSDLLPSQLTDNIGQQGVIYLVGAALFLGGTWLLDKRGYRGTATAFCGAGLVAALIGTVIFGTELGSDSGPVFVTIVGVFVSVVGAHGNRRATTWWGAVMVTAGVTAFILIQWKPSGVASGGAALVVSGLALVGLPLVGSAIRRANRSDNTNQ